MTSILATEGGWQTFTLKGGEWLILGLSGASAILALLVGWYLMIKVLQEDEGTDKMKEIAGAIQVGALAYLKRQFRTIGMILVPVAGDRRRVSEFTVGEVTIDFRILVTTTGSSIPIGIHTIYSHKKGVNLVSTGWPDRQKHHPNMGISLSLAQILYTCEVQNCGPHPGEHSIT